MKFVYVFGNDDKEKLIAAGYQLLKADTQNDIYTFKADDKLNFALNDVVEFVESDKLTF